MAYLNLANIVVTFY